MNKKPLSAAKDATPAAKRAAPAKYVGPRLRKGETQEMIQQRRRAELLTRFERNCIGRADDVKLRRNAAGEADDDGRPVSSKWPPKADTVLEDESDGRKFDRYQTFYKDCWY
jgi:hypothetical protein